MEYRQLPGTDLKVSRACLGTMTFGSQVDEAAARNMIDVCLNAGVNFFDTANAYNKGRSEEILGRLFEGRRDRIILASKVFNKMGDGPDDSGLSRSAILKAIDASLKRLNTDYLDIYYLHQPDYNTPLEETLETMNGVVRAGKVRYVATSNFAAWQIAHIFCLSERSGWQAPRVAQPMYNLLARGLEQEYVPCMLHMGVSSFVYNPLAGGLLTGKQNLTSGPLAGTRFDGNQMYLNRYWNEAVFRAVEELKNIAVGCGRTLIEMSLGWLLGRPGVDGVILGASRPEQLADNLRTIERSRPLEPQVLEACDAVWGSLRGVAPKYNR
jgi:aryl-alcohol dehydrogenase-like predicted oxidoreductase